MRYVLIFTPRYYPGVDVNPFSGEKLPAGPLHTTPMTYVQLDGYHVSDVVLRIDSVDCGVLTSISRDYADELPPEPGPIANLRARWEDVQRDPGARGAHVMLKDALQAVFGLIPEGQ